MTTTMNNYPDIEFQPLKVAIEEKARMLLVEINEENLRIFAEEVKIIAEGVMEQYAFKVYDLYTEGALKISDFDKLASFTDFTTGYQSKMLAWNKNHPIQLREQHVEIPLRPDAPKFNKYKPVVTLGVGTVVAIGLYIFSNAWVALAAELLALAVAYTQRRRQQKDQQAYDADLKSYNHQIGMKRMMLIKGLTEDLVKWLEEGKAYSDSVLMSFNL